MIGKVKEYDTAKGWGFITVPDDGDVFVHRSGLEPGGVKSLNAGQEVSLVLVEGRRGWQAAHVKVLNGGASDEDERRSH